ncbi:DUF1553 domain-containing protein [Planctomicrobium sp. SH664]|uniref:DUF1553 domain-containing protein n=1 Tax=Planctomicrobium sp. SH664 TaxID=3448125 RepID=UPI003F5C08DA
MPKFHLWGLLLLVSIPQAFGAEPVAIEIFDKGIVDHNVFPESLDAPQEAYSHDAFAFFRLPTRYISTGVADDRPPVTAVKATASIELPAGQHQFLVRSLGLSRLEIDGEALVETPAIPNRSFNDLAGIADERLLKDPGLRNRAPGIFERLVDFTSPGGEHQIRFTFLVGGKTRRAEINETTVSIRLQGEKEFYLLSPALKGHPYSDSGWWRYYHSENAKLQRLEKQRRQEAFDTVQGYWQERHTYAAAWAAEHPVPKLPTSSDGAVSIDRILAARSESQSAGSPQATTDVNTGNAAREFAAVRTLFEQRCVRCHRGKDAEGDLRLDEWDSLSKDLPGGGVAIVAGKPEQSVLLERIASRDESLRMPPAEGGEPLAAGEIELVRNWIEHGAQQLELPAVARPRTAAQPLTDLEFLRKVSLDTVGVVPSIAEIREFEAAPADRRRELVIDRLLADPRHADHWTSYWQNVLGENPNLINPTLNNTGPFRFWIYEALHDNKPFDLFVTELIRMEGGYNIGGPKGFEMASGVDVPMAAKGVVLTSAFLGMTTKCARCHDSPFQKTTQRELFELAAALKGARIEVPASSSVDLDALTKGARKPLIQVSLKVGERIDPAWPFKDLVDAPAPEWMIPQDASWRDQVAVQITRPENERFAQVIVNRVWKRLMGRGLVEPAEDWEHAVIEDSLLLDWMAREFVSRNYDVQWIERTILNSDAYQQRAVPAPELASAVTPPLRMLEPAQIADSLSSAFGKSLTDERMSLDLDISRSRNNSVDLGYVRRCWQLANLTNERDRPGLTLPETQPLVDLIEAFGWRSGRGDGMTPCAPEIAVTQPAAIANGLFVQRMVRITPGSTLEQMALKQQSLDELIDELFLSLLTRTPTELERQQARDLLAPQFDDRACGTGQPCEMPAAGLSPSYVTWSNHLAPGADEIIFAKNRQLQQGPEPSPSLQTDWRERLEDLAWAIINAPEFIYSP